MTMSPDDVTRLRALHRPGTPLLLPNAWDAWSARAVEAAGFPVVATTSSAMAAVLGHADGQDTPSGAMLAAVERIARAVGVPVTADLEAGYGLEPAELRERALAAGAAGINLEDSDHARRPALVDADRHAERIAAVRGDGALVVNARVDVHLRGGETAEALRRARLYADAGADCVYPIAVTDEATIAAFVDLGVPVNVLLSAAAPSVARLSALGVARISLGERLHAELEDGLRARLAGLRAEELQPPR